ncbi:MAG TPA: DUF4922 domain-containing protein [Deltaproteobacteria bacterium]|nr:DUF4922 domain-containing protein [Deltaproteobacteria bacterium]
MSPWRDHLIPPGDVLGDHAEVPSLSYLLEAFVPWQAERWPQLKASRAALADVEQRPLQVGSRSIMVQFNPGRTVNSTAKVDAASIQRRRCFLCADHLPPEEMGLPFGPDLVILANPFPILGMHLVIAHRMHRPQDAGVALDGLLDLAGATEGTLTVIYNGPRSGASAPDHLHLQAVASGILPEEVHALAALARGRVPGELLFELEDLKVWSDASSGRWIVGFVGSRETVGGAARVVIEALDQGDPEGAAEAAEPPLNLVATAGRPGEVVLLLFPRGAHRPACYFADEPHRRVVSPGAIDMAGVVVTVRQEDYARLRPEDLVEIFAEVSRPEASALIRDVLVRRLTDV